MAARFLYFVGIITLASCAVSGAIRAHAEPPSKKAATKQSFRDCSGCPLMVTLPAGEFLMGSPESEIGRSPDEGPQRRVTIAKPFAIGKYEVTFSEWDACVAKGGCKHKPSDQGWGRSSRPVINVSWDDAQQYVSWLASTTGKPYRLPSEAEWEYAARGVTVASAPSRPFWTGETIGYKQANYDANFVYGAGKIGVYRQKTVNAGSLPRNAFGLHEVSGNVWEWVADCYEPGYAKAPSDGAPVLAESCNFRILRGGAWNYYPWTLRSAARHATAGDLRLSNVGLRIALTLPDAAPGQSAEKGN